MLSPDQIEEAGDAVAAIYSEIETKLLDRLVETMAEGLDLRQTDLTALALLSQTHSQDLQAIVGLYDSDIKEATRETVASYLKASDADDVRRLGEGEPMYPQQVEATIEGIAHILSRNNIQMIEGAKKAFLDASFEAVTNVNTGMMTTERALHHAVRNLEREGIPIITYQNSKTGKVTVRNKVDVAVRRHIRTQIAQDGARLTMQRLNELDVALVEVSSHPGARPSHAEWQGRCYSLRGDVAIEGTKYPDFYAATRYGSVDGLLGANCRHSFGPYRHGAPRAYEPDPKHESGLPNDEVYEMTQQQRYLERQIREAKREVRGAQQLNEKLDTPESRANLAKAQKRLKQAQANMREFIEDSNAKSKTGKPILHRKPNREWAGDMPKSRTGGSKNPKPMPRRDYKVADDARIAKLQDASDKAYSKFTQGERMSLKNYTLKEFRHINQHLYKTVAYDEDTADMLDAMIESIDDAMDKFHLKDDIIAFRGTSRGHYDTWNVGETHSIKGYVSASAQSHKAEDFAYKHADRFMVEVRVPAGTRCLYIGENTDYPSNEFELLLGHGLKYKVIEKDANKMVLEVV